jgi:cytochrome c oxidase accessory protein FixG
MDELPTLDRLSSIEADGSRRNIQPADVRGRFVRARRVVYALLLLFYVALPFVRIDGRPAVQLDVLARRFYLFGAVFNAQDFWRVVFLLLVVGLGLFFVTTWLGRIWCGWACPQTVFLEGVYRRLERWIEGPRERRLRLAASPWSPAKVAIKAATHGSYLLVSLVLANVALAFFVSLPSLFQMVRRNPAENWTAFAWVMALTGALYFNFAWFREQLCIIVCPYGRLQSVLLDRDSLVIGYDAKRGEPRGVRRKNALPVLPQGDCVACNRCVAVCPTGIDIRNGTQLECIGCAQCIDACDEVMLKVGQAPGLIRYDSENGLENKPTRRLRPRLLVYGTGLALALALLVYTTSSRTPFEANVIRVRGAPYVIEGATVRNSYELHLVNKNAVATRLTVRVTAAAPVQVTLPTNDIALEPLAHFRLPLVVAAELAALRGTFDLRIEVHDAASGRDRALTVSFVSPAR